MNNPFKNQPVSEPPKSGTAQLREMLRVRTVRVGSVPLANIVRDCNDAFAQAIHKKTTREIAQRMAGDGASETTIRDIAKNLMKNLSGERPKDAASVSEAQLEGFIKGNDLPGEIKQQLAIYLRGGFFVYDPENDTLLPAANTGPKWPPPVISPPWQHPDPRVRAAQEELHAAIAATNR
jgi:hypothetical protein